MDIKRDEYNKQNEEQLDRLGEGFDDKKVPENKMVKKAVSNVNGKPLEEGEEDVNYVVTDIHYSPDIFLTRELLGISDSATNIRFDLKVLADKIEAVGFNLDRIMGDNDLWQFGVTADGFAIHHISETLSKFSIQITPESQAPDNQRCISLGFRFSDSPVGLSIPIDNRDYTVRDILNIIRQQGVVNLGPVTFDILIAPFDEDFAGTFDQWKLYLISNIAFLYGNDIVNGIELKSFNLEDFFKGVIIEESND